MLFDSYENAKKALDEFIHKNRRKSTSFENTIGGSEMASLDDKSQYGSFEKVVGTKLKLKEFEFNGNLFTRWGNLFEPVSRKLLETIYNCITIQSPSLYGFCEWCRYSPDDFTIIPLDIDGRIVYVILLVEYKSPFSRVPSDLIPDEYQHQINAGLASIPIVHSAVFFDTQYKVCKLSDLDYTIKYNRQIHNHKILRFIPIGLSFIGFYTDKDVDKNTDRIVDLGEADKKFFDKSIKSVLNKKQEIFYSVPDIKKDLNYKRNVMESFKKFCTEKKVKPTHIIPVKIFAYKSIIMQRTELDEFVKRLSGKIASAREIIERLGKLSYEDKYMGFYNMKKDSVASIKLTESEIESLISD
jgi:hypothetical protein